MRLIVEHINFHILLGFRNRQRARRVQHFLHSLAVLIAFVLTAAAPPPAVGTAAHSGDAHAHSSPPSALSTIRLSRILHFLARVIALIRVQLPVSHDRSSRLHRRRSLLLRPSVSRGWCLRLCRGQRTGRCLSLRPCRPAKQHHAQNLTRDKNVSPRENHCAHLFFDLNYSFPPSSQKVPRRGSNPAKADLPARANKRGTATSPWLEVCISKWLLLWSAAVL